MFVTQYWTLLYDFGQTAPISYARTGPFPNSTEMANPHFYSDNNNIFVNETLFEIYATYFENVILPLLGYDGPVGDFQSLNNGNQLTPVNVAFKIGYSCTQLQLKSWLNLIVSVLVADITFFRAAYGCVIWGGAWLQTRRSRGTGIFHCCRANGSKLLWRMCINIKCKDKPGVFYNFSRRRLELSLSQIVIIHIRSLLFIWGNF